MKQELSSVKKKKFIIDRLELEYIDKEVTRLENTTIKGMEIYADSLLELRERVNELKLDFAE